MFNEVFNVCWPAGLLEPSWVSNRAMYDQIILILLIHIFFFADNVV